MMRKILLVLSLMLVGLSGCYVRGYDDGHRRDHDSHEHQRGHDDRGGEHRD